MSRSKTLALCLPLPLLIGAVAPPAVAVVPPLAAAATALQAATERPAAEAPAAEPRLLDRVAVLGASVSAGFGLWIGGQVVGLDRVLDHAIEAEHGALLDASKAMFFLDPWGNGRLALDDVAEARPSLVVAIDFLFWYGYGDLGSLEARERSLERGLALLDELECPLVVGDLPDMTPAVGMFLYAAQVPSPDELRTLNARIEEWAAADADRLVVPLSAHLAAMRAGEAIEAGPVHWPARPARGEDPLPLLQRDELHTTLTGSCLLVALIAERLVGTREELTADDFLWDVRELERRVRRSVGAPAGSEGAAGDE